MDTAYIFSSIPHCLIITVLLIQHSKAEFSCIKFLEKKIYKRQGEPEPYATLSPSLVSKF